MSVKGSDDFISVVCPNCDAQLCLPRGLEIGVHVSCDECGSRYLLCDNVKLVQIDAVRDTQGKSLVFAKENVFCPHCGAEYEVEQSEFGQNAVCQICGEGFVVGQTHVIPDKPSNVLPNRKLVNLTCRDQGKVVRIRVLRRKPKILALGKYHHAGSGVSVHEGGRNKSFNTCYRILVVIILVVGAVVGGWSPLKDYVGEACYQKGKNYSNGIGVSKNDGKAVMWYRKAAKLGYVKAQFSLGECLLCGSGVKADENEAIKWLEKAAERGNVDAQWRLGRCYAAKALFCSEDAVSRNAFTWCMKAAEQGHDQAQFQIGRSYEEGLGVEKNISKALQWYRESANRGNSLAKESLRSLEQQISNMLTDKQMINPDPFRYFRFGKDYSRKKYTCEEGYYGVPELQKIHLSLNKYNKLYQVVLGSLKSTRLSTTQINVVIRRLMCSINGVYPSMKWIVRTSKWGSVVAVGECGIDQNRRPLLIASIFATDSGNICAALEALLYSPLPELSLDEHRQLLRSLCE